MNSRILLVPAAVLALVAACSNDAKPAAAPTSAAPTTPAEAVVDVNVHEFMLSASTASVAAGKVTFRVTNAGKLQHELVLMKTDNPVAALPLEATESKALEDGKGNKDVGEVEEVNPGTTKSGVFTLAPGHYVLLCNIVGHYAAGMRTAFTVT